ncbi:unnamed protein product, partial [Prunus brigantina]
MIFSQTSFALGGVQGRGEEVTPPLSLSLFPYLPTYFSHSPSIGFGILLVGRL